MDLPNALRSRVYSMVHPSAASMTATAPMATSRRSRGSWFIRQAKPRPSSPRILEGGTRTSSKNSSAVSWAFWPIFLRLRPRLKPGRSVSTSTSVMPLAPADVSVLAATMTRSAMPAVGDEGLLPVDDQLVALAQRRGADRLQVAARAGLGHGNRRDHLALGHARQPGALLLLAAVVEDVGRDDVGVQAEAGGREHALGHLLDHHGAVEEVGAGPAVLFRHVGEEEARLAGLLPHLAAHLAVLLPALVVGGDLAIDEGADASAEKLVLLLVDGARAGHGASPGRALRWSPPRLANGAPGRYIAAGRYCSRTPLVRTRLACAAMRMRRAAA